jgi:hypothetical protein
MKQIFSIIFFFLGAMTLQAQQAGQLTKKEASALVKKINEKILNAKHYSCEMNYQVFNTHKDSQPLETISGFYKRSGSNEHSMLLGIETIQNEHERVVVDTSGQSIVLTQPTVKPQLIEENLQSALASCNKISLTNAGGQSIIRFIPDDRSMTNIKSMEIVYDNDRFFITSISICYVNTPIPGYDKVSNPKIVIAYSNINTSHIPNSEFKTDSYLSKKNNTYKVMETYKDYTFFNQLSKENENN